MKSVVVPTILAVSLALWSTDGAGQGAPPAEPAPAPAPAPAPSPAPASPGGSPSVYPSWNGTNASLLPATFGTPLPADSRSYAPRTWSIVAGVAGLFAMAEGTLLALVAKKTYDDSNAPGYCVDDVCTQQGLDKRSGARTAADVATGSFVAGGLLLGGAVALFVISTQAKEEPRLAVGLAPGGLEVRGGW